MKAIRVEATKAKNNYEEENSIGRSLDRGLNNLFIETHSTFSWKDKPRPRNLTTTLIPWKIPLSTPKEEP